MVRTMIEILQRMITISSVSVVVVVVDPGGRHMAEQVTRGMLLSMVDIIFVI